MILTPLFIVLLVIVFILVWLFVKTIDHRKWLVTIVSIVFTPIVYFYIFYPLLNVVSSYHHKKYFESKAWIAKPALRFEMSSEITDKQIFNGKTKNEVESLLGKSEWFGWDDSIKANSEQIWNYNMGFKPGAFNNNQECLELVFKDNKLISAKQYQLELKFD